MQLIITASRKTLKQIKSEISGITNICYMGRNEYLITGDINSVQEYLIDHGQNDSYHTPYEDHNINFYCSSPFLPPKSMT